LRDYRALWIQHNTKELFGYNTGFFRENAGLFNNIQRAVWILISSSGYNTQLFRDRALSREYRTLLRGCKGSFKTIQGSFDRIIYLKFWIQYRALSRGLEFKELFGNDHIQRAFWIQYRALSREYRTLLRGCKGSFNTIQGSFDRIQCFLGGIQGIQASFDRIQGSFGSVEGCIVLNAT